eukprot:755360-Hanusia_phi.AAC.8
MRVTESPDLGSVPGDSEPRTRREHLKDSFQSRLLVVNSTVNIRSLPAKLKARKPAGRERLEGGRHLARVLGARAAERIGAISTSKLSFQTCTRSPNLPVKTIEIRGDVLASLGTRHPPSKYLQLGLGQGTTANRVFALRLAS